MVEILPPAIVYCHAVRCVVCIVKCCSEVFDYTVRMLYITAVLGSHEFGLYV
jgi:hypothetical protein